MFFKQKSEQRCSQALLLCLKLIYSRSLILYWWGQVSTHFPLSKPIKDLSEWMNECFASNNSSSMFRHFRHVWYKHTYTYICRYVWEIVIVPVSFGRTDWSECGTHLHICMYFHIIHRFEGFLNIIKYENMKIVRLLFGKLGGKCKIIERFLHGK